MANPTNFTNPTSQVILQPSGSKVALEHYQDTIIKPVSLSLIGQFASASELKDLSDRYPGGAVPTWGIVPGKAGQSKWERITPGDIAVFSGSGKIFASGVVSYKIHNVDLAAKLWGHDDNNQTWEYMYFLDEVQNQDISYVKFNRAVGYQDNNIIQGFTILDGPKSRQFLDTFDLASENYFPPIEESQYEDAILNAPDPSKPLDTVGKAKIRTEQGFLRKALFGSKKVGRCCLCGRQYPVAFLVAAHIKKRAECSTTERLDYKNIVMPACKFGCDDLYEKGYIAVKDGMIITLNHPDSVLSIKAYVDTLVGKSCSAWSTGSSKYFEAHRQKFSKM